jgi:hypothetical protein
MTPSEQQQAQDPNAVGISPEAVTQGYQQALADETQRRIVAEAAVQALRDERTELRRRLAALEPTTNKPQEGKHP